jgi:hypothetical protein
VNATLEDGEARRVTVVSPLDAPLRTDTNLIFFFFDILYFLFFYVS